MRCMQGNQYLNMCPKRKSKQIQKAVGSSTLVQDTQAERSPANSCVLQVVHTPLSLDLLQDWNTFLLRYNELDFCVSENETIKHGLNESTTPESVVVTSGQARSSTQVPLLLEDSGPINISVPITLTLDPQRPFGGYSRNITHLYATVLGQQVGLSGRFSALFLFVCVETVQRLLWPVLMDVFVYFAKQAAGSGPFHLCHKNIVTCARAVCSRLSLFVACFCAGRW